MLRIISLLSLFIFLVINIYHYNVSYEVIKLEKNNYIIENEILDMKTSSKKEINIEELD